MADDRIFAELKRDHDRQRKLLDAIAETSGDSEERRTLFEELRLELQAHAAAEEESLYATMLADPDLREMAVEEVREAKEQLVELVTRDSMIGTGLPSSPDQGARA